MKTKLIFLCFIVFLFTSCEKEEVVTEKFQVEFKGIVQEIGPTTFMYGTHKITYNGKLYALKSSTINLDEYIDKTVTVRGDKVKGYPVDGGPEYVDVKKIVE